MKRLTIIAAALVIAGCTDAKRAELFAYGNEATVTCYSGGDTVFADTSTGKVQQIDGDGDGITFKSKATGRYVRAYADCIVISLE